MELQKLCTMCSNVITILCGACKCTAYCSAACLKSDMPIHQILCGELQKFMTPPSASARRGIFFPVDQKTPQFVWATTQWCPPEDGDPSYEKLNLKPYIGDEVADKIRIQGNYIRSRPRDDQIMVFMRDTCCVDGSKVNSSITALTEGNAFHSWRGGMLAMKVPTLELDPGQYANMDLVDFRDVVDLFRSYRSEIQMSDARCNRHHKGPDSPLDDMLKARFKQAGKSNSKKTASSGTTASSSLSSFGKMGVNIDIDQGTTTSVKDMLNHLNLGEKNLNETTNEIRGSALPHEYMLKAGFLQPGKSKSNKTASRTASSSSFGKTGVNIDIEHAATTCVKDMLDSLNLGEKNPNETLNGTSAQDVQAELELPGVRINCIGDRKSGRAQFEAIKVSIRDPVWSATIPSISKLVGLPIRVQRIPSGIEPQAKSKGRKKPVFDEQSQAATFLHMNANPKAKDWGWASPIEWQQPAGSVVVVHAERKEIYPQHVEALCYLCQYVMQPLFEDSMGAGMDPANPIPKRDVMRRLTPREFQLFYDGFSKWKQDNDPNYKTVYLPSVSVS